MQPALETARLRLTPLQLDDAAQVQPLFAEWEVVRYLNHRVPWPFPADGVHRFYAEHALPAMERGDEWHWMLRLKHAPERIVGSISLMRGDNNRGFWLAREYWGRGLMTEAAERTTAFWFEELGFERLRAPKAAGNIGSVRVSEKTGMRRVAVLEEAFVSGLQPAEVWEITRAEWLARSAAARSL